MVPYVDAVEAVTVMCVLLFVLHVCMLRRCEGERVTAVLVWGMSEVLLWLVQGMCVVYVVQVLCISQLTYIDECGAWDERSW